MPTQSQIVNGQQYAVGSPEWYNAQAAEQVRQGGLSGSAAGAGEADYLSYLSPSLAGLYSATGMNGGVSTLGQVSYPGAGTTTPTQPGTVGYSAPSTSGISAAAVNPGDLTGGTSTLPDVQTIAPVNLDAADAASFATAKDEAGQTAGASMTGLQQALAARGLGGAGYEAGQIGNTLATAANTIGAAGRAQAVNDAALRSQAALANLNAGVTQRGQTIGAQESDAARKAAAAQAGYSGSITQRSQDLQAQEAAANLATEQAGTAYQGGVTQRSQDESAAQAAADRAAQAAATAYGGQITQRQQDMTLAEQQAQQKSQQTLAILQSVLGGNRAQTQPYVY